MYVRCNVFFGDFQLKTMFVVEKNPLASNSVHWHWKQAHFLGACHHHEEFYLFGTASNLLIHI